MWSCPHPSACRWSPTVESRSSWHSSWLSSSCGARRSWAGLRIIAGGIANVNARILAFLLATVGMLIVSGIAAPQVRAAPAPTLSIVSPSPNAVIGNGSPVVVVFAVTNFNLTDSRNGTSSPDSGHVDVFVDGGWTAKASINTIVLALPSGPHTIRLRLVTDNGSALNPDVTASVAVMMTQGPAGGMPGLSIFYPRESALPRTDSMRPRYWPSPLCSSDSGSSQRSTASWRPADRARAHATLSRTVLQWTDGTARAMPAPRDLPVRGHESIGRGRRAVTVDPHAGERPGHRQWHAGDRELRGGQLRPRAARSRRAGRESN